MTRWRGSNVLVTGADGFIGSNLTKRLLSLGARVVTVERDARPHNSLRMLGILEEVTVVRGDICDLELMCRILNEYSVKYCFHLAAQALVGVANTGPLSTFETNVRGTWVLLEACRLNGSIDAVVVASSDKAYGIHEILPYREDAPLLGLYPYDVSKACADAITRSYWTVYGLKTAVTRNANVYGPGDMNFSRLIPDAVRCALKGIPLEIRSDGKMERDYLFVDDAANAYITLAENIQSDQIAGQAFNFGAGKPISVLEVCNTVFELAQTSVKPEILDIAKYEIPQQYLDTSKARDVLGWNVKHDLRNGLLKTIEWYRSLIERYPHLVP